MDSIFNNGYSLELIGPSGTIQKTLYDGSNYFNINSNTQFAIKLANSNNVRTDAHIWIGDRKIGIYRINPNSSVVVNKDKNNNIFTTYKYQKFNSGLIKVVFVSEKEKEKEIENNVEYINPVRTTMPNINSHRWNCHNDYTDGVTPVDKLNRRCSVEAIDYELNHVPNYGDNLKSSFVFNSNRFSLVKKLNGINVDTNGSVIFAQLIINDDIVYENKPYTPSIRPSESNPSILPKNNTSIVKQMARHKCPFYYNKTFVSENDMCPNHVNNNGIYKLPAYSRYTNGVFGGPSYNSWILGSADPLYVNRNIYKENNYN